MDDQGDEHAPQPANGGMWGSKIIVDNAALKRERPESSYDLSERDY